MGHCGRVLVLGLIVRYPLGGMAWHYLQYVLGLARLGYDVYFVEDSGDWPECYNPDTFEVGTDPAYGLAFAAAAFSRLGLGDRWAYHDAHTARWLGPCGDRMPVIAASADLLLNVSGANQLREELAAVPVRALIDTDPAFTQVRHLTDPVRRDAALRHTCFFTFAAHAASGDGLLPKDGFPWLPTRQPVVLDAWPVVPPPVHGKFTTVMQWDSYAALEHDGIRYGLKCDTFWPLIDLPAQAGSVFDLAIDRLPPDAEATIRRHGWGVRHPYAVTRDPWTYQTFIRESMGEFAPAKHGYVVSRSGWFSERSAAYLASGRPVVAQETGWSDWLPAGEGLFAFTDVTSAAAALREVQRDYQRHCRAARALACEYFDSSRVLRDLVAQAMGTAPPLRP